jgi:hypothetical protein
LTRLEEKTMGMYPMKDPEKCPKCRRDLSLAPKPERVSVKDFPAEVTYGVDPVCGGRWNVWDRTSPLRKQAQPFVDGEG